MWIYLPFIIAAFINSCHDVYYVCSSSYWLMPNASITVLQVSTQNSNDSKISLQTQKYSTHCRLLLHLAPKDY